MATQEILHHLLSHTLKVPILIEYRRFCFVWKREATSFDFVQAMLMSEYGSFKRRSNSSTKGWQTGSHYLKYFHLKYFHLKYFHLKYLHLKYFHLKYLHLKYFHLEYLQNLYSRINHKFSTREQLEQEVNNLRSNLANLEALQHNTKVKPGNVLQDQICKLNWFLKMNCSPRTTWWWPSRRWRSWGRSWAGWGRRAPATCLVRIKSKLVGRWCFRHFWWAVLWFLWTLYWADAEWFFYCPNLVRPCFWVIWSPHSSY